MLRLNGEEGREDIFSVQKQFSFLYEQRTKPVNQRQMALFSQLKEIVKGLNKHLIFDQLNKSKDFIYWEEFLQRIFMKVSTGT